MTDLRKVETVYNFSGHFQIAKPPLFLVCCDVNSWEALILESFFVIFINFIVVINADAFPLVFNRNKS